MWVDPVGIEQGTSEPVARHKAARFACPLVVDLCAGIGGDALALAARPHVLAVDLDPGMCRRIRYNAEVYEVAERVLPVRARAETFAIPAAPGFIWTPTAGPRGRKRARSLDDYAPGPAFWTSLSGRVAAGAIKLSPASDFPRHFAGPEYEVELISLRGECKEATVWFGELTSCRRRATRLPENAPGPIAMVRHQNGLLSPLSGTGSMIPTPHSSAPACSMDSPWSTSLRRVGEGVDYLTSDWLVSSPFLTAFEVQGRLSPGPQAIETDDRQNQIGTLEIKVRGVDFTPESLRARLRLRGDQAATLLVIGGRRPGRVPSWLTEPRPADRPARRRPEGGNRGST